MDFNHDYNGDNEFLLSGNAQRLQQVKAAIDMSDDLLTLQYTGDQDIDLRSFQQAELVSRLSKIVFQRT